MRQSVSHAISKHSVDQLSMAVSILLAPLVLKVETIGPEVATSAADLSILPVPLLQERVRRGPVARRALGVEGGRLAHAERVRDLVHRRALRHVGPVRAESEIAVVVRLGRGNPGRVGDPDGLVGVCEAFVPLDRGRHGLLDAIVCVGFVRARTPGPFQRPGQFCRGNREASASGGQDREPHAVG